MQKYKLIGIDMLALAGVVVLYWLLFGSVGALTGSLHGSPDDDQLFVDFLGHYYPMGEAFLVDPKPVEGYLYGAFFASWMVFFALFPASVAVLLWTGLQGIFTAWFYAFSHNNLLRSSLFGRVLYLLLLLTSLPLLHNFKFGQVSVLITLGMVFSVYYQHLGRSAVAGIILGMATSIKYYPAILVIYFLVQRDLRLLGTFALTMLVCNGLLPGILLGVEGWFKFTAASLRAMPAHGDFVGAGGSQYVPHVIMRWVYNLGFQWSDSFCDYLRWSGWLLFLFNIVIADWFRRRGGVQTTQLTLASILLSLPLVVPSSWPHYFVYLPFCQMALWLIISERVDRGSIRHILRIPLVVSIVSSNLLFFNLFSAIDLGLPVPSWQVYYRAGGLTLAYLLSLVSLYGVVLFLFWRNKKGGCEFSSSVQFEVQ